MAKRKKTNVEAAPSPHSSRKRDGGVASTENVVDYRHKNVTRLNIPPAGLAARGQIVKEPKLKWDYNPHLAPSLRFDGTGKADSIEAMVDAASRRVLTVEEATLLKEALRNNEPWLEWAGKREQQWCVADPVALHIHERISTQAVLKVARRLDVQRDLFADPEHEYREAVQFYKHPMDWTNRMILGDSLAVMASLARREALTGKVQMIYMDPPYGIKYASNFQPEVGRRDVKDKDEDLTREPEMVKAYRDTWTLGVHSYLSYLRDRLLLCKELLADSGSVFVQIGDDNVQRVRLLLDEVFGSHNFISQITFRTKIPLRTTLLANVSDYVLWYAKDSAKVKYRKLFEGDSNDFELFNYVATNDGYRGPVHEGTEKGKRFASLDLSSSGATTSCIFKWEFSGRIFNPTEGKSWKTNQEGMARLVKAERLFAPGGALRYVLYHADYPVGEMTSLWSDTLGAGGKLYVVQTNAKVIERCLLMTTDPGDLVLDPTCGSGTTAYVAENWGRRWITIDCSRVALAIARQRVLTAKFDFFQLRPTSAEDVQRNPDGPWLSGMVNAPSRRVERGGGAASTFTFDCKTVPHVTLKSIAQNQTLDSIFDKWEPILGERLTALNKALKTVPKDLRQNLALKLATKQKAEGKKAITDADRRRWILPVDATPSSRSSGKRGGDAASTLGWEHWTVPFDTDPDWPKALQQALTEYRKTWRQKMDETNACIAARADEEELVDQPVIDKGKVRVSGPFTMEGIIPAEESIDAGEEEDISRKDAKAQSPIGRAPEELETFGIQTEPQNAEAYLDRMIRLLREDGVRFPDNKVMKFAHLEVVTGSSVIHAQGVWANGEKKERKVAVVFGPQYGPLTTLVVEESIRSAARRGYDDLVFAAFSFAGEAQVTIQEVEDPALKLHMAQIRPDVNMGDLLKTTVSSQLFTVSGSPRTRVEAAPSPLSFKRDGGVASTKQYIVHMEGVDIYDPVSNTVRSTGAEKVAAWFLDSDYDGRCFCVCQAFFPDKSAWEKLGKALGGALDEDAFARLSGTVSLPFPEGEHKRIAVKVIDPRGNEVLRVHRLDGTYGD